MHPALDPWKSAGIDAFLKPGPFPRLAFDKPPQPWDVILSKAPPSPRFVFTYLGLGNDLTAVPVAERRAQLVALLDRLAFPKGTIAYVPTDLPNHAPHEVSNFFWACVAQLCPQTIACFGSDAFSALAPLATRADTHWFTRNIRLLRLSDLAELSQEPPLFDAAVELLKKRLARCP